MVCICGSHKIKDLTNGLGEGRNYYCPDCKAHYYNGRWWTRAQWEQYIELPYEAAVEFEQSIPIQTEGS